MFVRQDSFEEVMAPATAEIPGVDVGIVTIKDEELTSVLSVFTENPRLYVGPRSHRHYNLRSTSSGRGTAYRVAIVRQVQQGGGQAHSLTRDLIEELRPRLVLVVGIAGGVPSEDFTLGDVVVSLQVNDYTVNAQKPGQDREYAIGGGPIAEVLRGGVANLSARLGDLGDWTSRLPQRPNLNLGRLRLCGPVEWQARVRQLLKHHFRTEEPRSFPRFISGVLGSSDGLIMDPEVIISWLKTSRNLLAIEMESAGVYLAVGEQCAMLSIRGISDIVGLGRDERWTRYACASAAAFTQAYLRTTPIDPPMAATSGEGEPGSLASDQRDDRPSRGNSDSRKPEPLQLSVELLDWYRPDVVALTHHVYDAVRSDGLQCDWLQDCIVKIQASQYEALMLHIENQCKRQRDPRVVLGQHAALEDARGKLKKAEQWAKTLLLNVATKYSINEAITAFDDFVRLQMARILHRLYHYQLDTESEEPLFRGIGPPWFWESHGPNPSVAQFAYGKEGLLDVKIYDRSSLHIGAGGDLTISRPSRYITAYLPADELDSDYLAMQVKFHIFDDAEYIPQTVWIRYVIPQAVSENAAGISQFMPWLQGDASYITEGNIWQRETVTQFPLVDDVH